jgi:hypothetical protein
LPISGREDFESEVVELILLEAEQTGDCVRVSGKLSHYAFRIDCAEVTEKLNDGN